jgi:CheY-like chemotaxis protein
VSATADAGIAVITVTDTGVGIPPAMLPKIFDMFTQLQAHRDRALGGLGIGLTLAKRLVELHGGTIEAKSDGPGRGSRFTVRLPLLTDAGQLSAPRRDESPAGAARRVLIADDNADTAEMMQVMLSFKGHDVRVARDGVEAVEIAGAFAPHIAFLDIGMPRMDGYEAARQIRQMAGRRIVLVALTGWGQDEDKRRSREAGFDQHLTKPPEPDVVDRLIADCLE